MPAASCKLEAVNRTCTYESHRMQPSGDQDRIMVRKLYYWMNNMKRARLENAIGCLPDKWGLNFQTCNIQFPNDTCLSYYEAYYYSGAMHTCKHVEPSNKYGSTQD